MYHFGWKPDHPDYRDFKYAVHPEMQQAIPLPSVVDLRPEMSPVEDQGNMGSCVAHATVGNLEFLELQGLIDKTKTVPEEFGSSFADISRMFVYANARILDGTLSRDEGTYLRSAVKAISKWGICRETAYPYTEANVFKQPSTKVYQEARQHLISSGYYRLDNQDINQLKQCLAQGFPFIYGMSIYTLFMNPKNGQIITPGSNGFQDRFLGGHALCCVGYDDSHSIFIVRNSWSSKWGVNGYCYIPYAYLTNPDLASDFWTVRN